MTRTPAFGRYVRDLLVELCAVDTTPNPDVAVMRRAERRCFGILERELRPLPFPGGRLERRPINPAIQKHPHFSALYFTRSPRHPRGLSAETAYAGRANLLYLVPDQGARDHRTRAVGLNAHVDVVSPYFPPRARNGVVFGRGACDDKGQVVTIVAALRLLAQLTARPDLRLHRGLAAMFVIDEETGGNGSLSLALDAGLRRFYDCLVVCEGTDLKLHPANRGAVWYRAELKRLHGLSALEMFAFVNEQLEKEGAALRAESRHPLFPQRPVQTCHGILGPYGEMPSRICGRVEFAIRFARPPGIQTERLVRDCLDAGLAGYVGRYGDKTQVKDPATGRPVVRRHLDLRRQGNELLVTVHGATGHMGAIAERDGAITKLAHLVRSLVYSRARLELVGGPMELVLVNDNDREPLVLEGGQGFLPTHDLDEVMQRLRQAAERGAEDYLRRLGRRERGAEVVTVTYDKLHNVAFDGNPHSPTMRNALAVARLCGLGNNEPVQGWTVSCDARLFAAEYPELPVLTFGPGRLALAHSDQEQIALEDIRAAVEFLVLFILQETGTARVV